MVPMHDTPQISPEHKHVTREVVAQLPKVLLHEHLVGAAATTSAPQTPEGVEKLVRKTCAALADDGVIYAELRLNPDLHAGGGMTARQVLDAALAGLDPARVDARLILTVSRAFGRVGEIARLAVDAHGGQVAGFALTGDGEGVAVGEHGPALALLRENYVPVTIEAGLAAGVESIAEAVQAGAVRLSHGARIFEDFGVNLGGIAPGRVSSWVRDRRLALELCPTLELGSEAADELIDHPLTLLQQLGFTCTVNTGDRSVGTLTDQFMALVETFDYGLEELFDLTLRAVENSFCEQERRQELLDTRILPSYEELAEVEEE